MKVTDIKAQVKRAGRYSIFVDGKYAFSFGELELLNSGLKLGKALSQEKLADLKDTARLDKAYDRVLNYIAIRRRSEWEIREYLKRKEYEAEIIEEITGRLAEKDYVDDLAFARAWVENRRLLKAISKRRLQQELRAKRVSDDHIEQALRSDETDEQEVLKELVAKKRQQTRYQDNLKLMQHLSRQGYNYADIKEALSEEDV
jgi:regulatory protein